MSVIQPDEHGARSRVVGGAWFIALGVAVAMVQIVRIAASNRIGAASQFVDDAYYYFKVAQHVVAGDGSTFDGISHTNGYHPLWLIVLLPVFGVVRSRTAALTAVKGVCGLLWIATLWQVGRIGRAVDAPGTNGTAAGAMWLGCLPIALYSTFYARSMPFAGVETALVVPLILIAVARLMQTRAPTPRAQWAIGAWLAAAVLARLDAVYVVAMLALMVALRLPFERFTDRVSAAARIGAPAAIMFVVDVIVNKVWFGAALTTSTRAKTMSGGTAHHFALHQYFVDPASMPIVVGIGTASGLVVVSAAVTARLARGDVARREQLTRLADIVTALWVAGALSTVVFDLQSSWALWPWYYYEAFLVLLLGPGIVLASLAPALRLGGPRQWPVAIAAAGAVGIALGGILRVDANGTENFYTQNAKGAMALNKALPRNAVVAMGDRAGIVAYFLDRPVVQVEGIVNSNEYLDAVPAAHAHAFLKREHVTFYAKSAHLADRLALEADGGLEPGAKECGWRFEPYFGAGDKVVFRVCRGDIVFHTPVAAGEQLTVWRYQGGLDIFTTT